MQSTTEKILSIEKLDDFEDEYVYDIEVNDTHTFFANDILVHNSIYVEFGRLVKFFHIPKERQIQFVLDVWEQGCYPYMLKKYDEYAESYNCDKNLQKLELEKIADTTILMAKKHYAMSECWKEPGIFLEPMEEVIYKGLEIIQGSTPPFARECQKDFTNYILMWYQDKEEKIPFELLIQKIKKYKQDFNVKTPDEIAKGATIGDYSKFVLNDKNNLALGLHCPIHVKASGIANFMLNKPENKKYKLKYNMITSKDKVKWYYAKCNNNVKNADNLMALDCFAYLPGSWPGEYALPIDYDMQFEKTILEPCNRILKILGYSTLNASLYHTTSLW